MSIWDVPLGKLQESRLLALRMHVARYVVRAGARQRSVVVVLGGDEMRYAGTLVELLEAAGARSTRVVGVGEEVPEAEVVLMARSPGSLAELKTQAQVWVVDVEWLVGGREAWVVESVEALIRIVMPEALGANGTPPDESIAVRLR